MKKFLQKVPEQVKRLFVVFVIIIGGALAVRALLPAHLKDESLHVRSTIEREVAKPIRYAGSSVCADCHDQYGVKQSGYHRSLSCETCHGPSRGHAENPGEIKPVAPTRREFCSHCHTYDPSRPTGFPQINPAVHNPLKACVSCHNPHDPKPPSVPQECQACHAEIARTKAVSAHVLLECTTCHTVPNEHKVTPRLVKATIPLEREFCGRCHAQKATVKEAPHIDLGTHGEKYLCWQCHYPHMPEAD